MEAPVHLDTVARRLHEALDYLAADDPDGARARNDIGFSAFDSDFGHSLAGKDRWSARQMKAAAKLAYKYRKQLKAIDFTKEELAGLREFADKQADLSYQKSDVVAKPDVKATYRVVGDLVEIKLPWALVQTTDLMTQIKAIPSRRWNREDKVWTVPVEMLDEVRHLAESYPLEQR